MSKHYVYKYVFDGKPIYVGITSGKDVYGRLKQHGRSGDNIARAGWSELRKSKIFFYEVPDRNVADALETAMIREYMPKYNRAKKGDKWGGIPINYESIRWEEADLDVVWNNKPASNKIPKEPSNAPQKSRRTCSTYEELMPYTHVFLRLLNFSGVNYTEMRPSEFYKKLISGEVVNDAETAANEIKGLCDEIERMKQEIMKG